MKSSYLKVGDTITFACGGVVEILQVAKTVTADYSISLDIKDYCAAEVWNYSKIGYYQQGLIDEIIPFAIVRVQRGKTKKIDIVFDLEKPKKKEITP